jgi:hypothetical protein
MLFRKRLRSRQFPEFKPVRLAQGHFVLKAKHRFAAAVPDVHMNGAMFVAVKQKLVSFLSENSRHPKLKIADSRGEGNEICHAIKSSQVALRFLDRAVINWCLDFLERERKQHYHTVRGPFLEGTPAFPDSRIQAKSHLQIAVRDPEAIIGYPKPYGV